MRNSIMLALAVPFALVSCGHADRTAGGNDVDLQRDLKLAATSTIELAQPRVNPANFDRLETVPHNELQEAKRLRKRTGSNTVASKSPDLHATEIPEGAATPNVPQVEKVATAAAPTWSADPVATMPRSSGAAAAGKIGAGDYGPSAGGGGAGILGGIGPIIGVVIRGGGVGGDNCEPHGRGQTPGVYLPQPGGYGGTTRFPVFPHGGRL
ncbi:MAG: hypothetical protein ACRENQ_03165 [Gemmatimonadaceae bacterium]